MNTLLIILSYLIVFVSGYQVGRIYTARSIIYTITTAGRKTFPNYDLEMSKALLGELNDIRKKRGKDPLSIRDIK